jgi:hypothetical protein
MHPNPTAELVLEPLPNGQHAWLRPAVADQLDRYRLNPDRVVIVDQVESAAAPEPFIPRDKLPEWVFETRTHFLVWAPTAERALRWFVDESDIDVDTEILTFGQVDLVGQTVRSMEQEPEPRYVVTDQGRRDLAMSQLFDKGPTVADVARLCHVCGKPSIDPLSEGRCIVCELLQRTIGA